MWNSVTASEYPEAAVSKGLFQRHGVGAGRIFLAAEGAQAAGRHADVRRIDVAIDVEVGLVAVHALAHEIRHPSHGENVAGAVKRERVGGIEPLAGHDFVVDRPQARIVRLKSVGSRVRTSHCFDDIAGAVRASAIATRATG